MKTSRYSVSRQKACQQCAKAKTKCLHREASDTCQRCWQRGTECSNDNVNVTVSAAAYPSPPDGEHSRVIADLNTDFPREIHSSSGGTAQSVDLKPAQPGAINDPASTSEPFDFTNISLVCPINPADINNRWLNSYIPTDQQKPKSYPAAVTNFISRMLSAYVGTVVRGRGAPPLIHQAQLLPSTIPAPLATCFSVARMCENVLPGSQSTCTDVLRREMTKLYDWRGTFDNWNMLAAFQAYLIYAMILFFRLDQSSNVVPQQAMMNLQELACMSARQGLVCHEEQRLARPQWESWIVAEAKRRTLYTMYLFDSVLLVKDGLPTFMATEVHGLLAPGPKLLWSTQGRQCWDHAYTQHLADWTDGSLTIDELWPVPAEYDAKAVAERHSRADRWLEAVDEYGTMMYAVTSCTHGG